MPQVSKLFVFLLYDNLKVSVGLTLITIINYDICYEIIFHVYDLHMIFCKKVIHFYQVNQFVIVQILNL